MKKVFVVLRNFIQFSGVFTCSEFAESWVSNMQIEDPDGDYSIFETPLVDVDSLELFPD